MLDRLSRFAHAGGLTNAQVILDCLLCKLANLVPIAGTRRINYIEQNGVAAAMTLSPTESDELDAVFLPGAT